MCIKVANLLKCSNDPGLLLHRMLRGGTADCGCGVVESVPGVVHDLLPGPSRLSWYEVG